MTEKIVIDFPKTRDLIGSIVKELGGEYVYTDQYGDVAPSATCTYVFNGRGDGPKVGCIVGRFFNKLGIELNEMLGGGDSEDLVRELIFRGRIEIDSKSRAALKLAQVMQDQGSPYGAVEAVVRGLSEILGIYSK